MTDVGQNPQWELIAEAVSALGGKATRAEVLEYLKRSLPEIPFSTVSAELNAVAVNAPALGINGSLDCSECARD